MPLQTFFHLSSKFTSCEPLEFLLKRGAHESPPAESLAPFHQDPAQRIVGLITQSSQAYPFFRVGALLKLLEGREGTEILWDEWKSRVVTPSVDLDDSSLLNYHVLGCRLSILCRTPPDTGLQMEVYDFSIQGYAKYRTRRANARLGGVKYLSSTGAKVRVPFDGFLTGYYSNIFSYVSVTVS